MVHAARKAIARRGRALVLVSDVFVVGAGSLALRKTVELFVGASASRLHHCAVAIAIVTAGTISGGPRRGTVQRSTFTDNSLPVIISTTQGVAACVA